MTSFFFLLAFRWDFRGGGLGFLLLMMMMMSTVEVVVVVVVDG